MVKYKFELWRNRVLRAELSVQGVQYGYGRNIFKNCTFTYNANKATDEVKDYLIKGSEFKIYRQGEDESKLRNVWAGEIKEVKKTINNRNEKYYDVTCEHWGKVYLTSRYLTANFTNTEESTIAWSLLNQTQTDLFLGVYTLAQVDFGITSKILETTNNKRDKSYSDDELLKSLQQLADLEDLTPNPQRIRGFRLTPDLIDDDYLEFSWYANYGTTRNITYTNPVIKEIIELDSLDGFGNRIIATGQNNITETAYSTDIDILALYRMRQAYVSKTNITTNASLLEEAEQELIKRLEPSKIYELTLAENDIFTGKYREGDLINIQYIDDEDFINLNAQMRVYEIDISFNDKNIEQTTIKVADFKPVSTQISPTDRFIKKVLESEKRVSELEK